MTSFYPSGNSLQRAIRSLRQEDLGTFAYKLASETGFRRVLLLERPLDDPIADPAPALPVEFAALCAHEIDDYLAAGATAVALGSELVGRSAPVSDDDLARIEAQAALAVATAAA